MENTITQQITTDQLWEFFDEQYSWSGYLWQDDQDKPFVFKEQLVSYREYFMTKIPFIIEGFLVSHPKNDTQSEVETKTISLTIKNIDGVYYCYKSEDFADLKPVETFPALEILDNKGIKTLEFIPVFKKQNDPFSPDFQEYVYSHQIFKGITS